MLCGIKMVDTNKTYLELDFDTNKQNLIDFMKSRTELTDYDYEGSAINSVMDTLSYNTMYNAIYANMAVNESFLDTAIKRDSVVSKAKMLNYTPNSATASTALINITINENEGLDNILIPRGTKFSSQVDSNSYIFTTMRDYLALYAGNNQYVVNNVEIKQGKLVSTSFIAKGDSVESFILNNSNIDTSTIEVTVQQSPTNLSYETYKPIEDITSFDMDGNYYIINETYDGNWQIIFGDDILFKKIKNNNVVIVSYLITDGEEADGIHDFTSENINGYIDFNIETVQKSLGGGSKESIESIRTLAPLSFADQKKLTTDKSYQIILSKLPVLRNSVDSISVWGGQDNIPPKCGTVFVSLKPKEGKIISKSIKEAIVNNYINKSHIVTMKTEFVDPVYLYLDITTKFKYNNTLTSKSTDQLIHEVENVIKQYSKGYLEYFKTNFEFSPFTTIIDKTDPSIKSNLTNVRIKRKIKLKLGVETAYTVRMLNAFEKGSLISSYFDYNEPNRITNDRYYLDDDGNGNVRLMKLSSDSKQTIIKAKIGEIDYNKGIIDITSFTPTNYINSEILSISVTPTIKNVKTTLNNILSIDNMNVTGEIDTSLL